MAAYVAGEQAAFQELFGRYAPLLLGLFRRQGASQDDAQDLLQQTFLQLHRARLDYRPGARLRSWLFTIALNLRRELLRRTARRPTTALGLEPAAKASTPDPEKKDEARRLQAALAALPAAQREVIELHWFQGLPFADVAEVVGASLSAVKVRAHRGYERLRELLSGGAP